MTEDAPPDGAAPEPAAGPGEPQRWPPGEDVRGENLVRMAQLVQDFAAALPCSDSERRLVLAAALGRMVADTVPLGAHGAAVEHFAAVVRDVCEAWVAPVRPAADPPARG